MTAIVVEVPAEVIAAAGSEELARQLMLQSMILELVRSGRMTVEQAAAAFGESPSDWMRLAETGGAFEFWNDPTEDVYALSDGEFCSNGI
jgi:hypothetical protein